MFFRFYFNWSDKFAEIYLFPSDIEKKKNKLCNVTKSDPDHCGTLSPILFSRSHYMTMWSIEVMDLWAVLPYLFHLWQFPFLLGSFAFRFPLGCAVADDGVGPCLLVGSQAIWGPATFDHLPSLGYGLCRFAVILMRFWRALCLTFIQINWGCASHGMWANTWLLSCKHLWSFCMIYCVEREQKMLNSGWF